MKPGEWERIEALFAELVAHPPEARPELLVKLAGGDEELRREVESLLACDRPGLRLERAVREAAAAIFLTEAATGERVGSYRLIRRLGQGGMGTVYLAVRADDQYEKQVAIKLVSLGMETAQSAERFRRERQILATLEHPYIARLMDGGSATLEGFPDQTPYIVMEYVEGVPVHDFCDGKHLNLVDRVQLFLKVCEAVAHAHQKLVVHRDLKPSNILVTADGSPKLLDFGIAKLLKEESVSGGATLAGLGMTPDYASPEQVREERITAAADVYSLGAILYLLLSGVKPHRFSTYTQQEVREVICERDPAKLSEVAAPHLRGRLRGDLEAIVAMAMRKEPQRRYSSVEQLSADLVRYLEGWPVKARQGNLGYRAEKYARRNRAAIVAGMLIAGSLAMGTAVATYEAMEASRARSRAEMERAHAVASQVRAEMSEREALRQAEEARHERAYAEVESHEAGLQRAFAEDQRRVADRRFGQVHELAGKFLMDFHHAIAKLPGATPARKMVLQTGLQYYDTLVKEAGNNRQLLEEIANGYDSLADVQGNPAYPNLGDAKGALASYGKALAIRRKIVDPSPAFAQASIQCLVSLSLVAGDQLDFKGSEEYLRQALSIAQQSPAAGSFEVRGALTRIYAAQGDLRILEGRNSDAVEPYTKQLALVVQIAVDDPNKVEAEGRIALAHTKLGDILTILERGPEALDHLHQALEIDRRISSAQPDNMVLERKLWITYYVLGRLLMGERSGGLAAPGELRECLEQESKLADKMAAADPENQGALADAGLSAGELGRWLRDQKQPVAALVPLNHAVTIGERLRKLVGENSGNEARLMIAYRRVGATMIDLGRYEEASERLTKANECLANLENKNPGTILNGIRRGALLDEQARLLAAQKRWNEAARVYHDLIAIFDALMLRDPANDMFRNEQPAQYTNLADCYAAVMQWDSAVGAIQSALKRFEQIEARRPLRKAEEEARVTARANLALWSSRRP